MKPVRLVPLLAFTLALNACSWMPSWLGGPEKEKEILPGERIAILPSSAANLTPDESLKDAPLELPEAIPTADWPQHGGNAGSAVIHPALPEKLEERESASVGDGNAFQHGFAIPPVVGEDMVFAMDAIGALSAHKIKSLDKIWESKGVSDADESAMLGGGLAYGEGKLFAVSGSGLVAAFDPKTGKEIWRQEINTPIRAALKIYAGRVFIVTADSQLFALEAKSGGILWSHRGISEGASFLSFASPSMARDAVVAPYSSGEIYALSVETGKENWTDSLISPKRTNATSLFADIGSDPVIMGNALYVTSNAGMLGAYRLDNGQRIWEQPIASLDLMWVAGERLFVLTSDETFLSVNRMDGRIYWTQQLPRYKKEKEHKGRFSWHGPILAGGRLYVTGAHGKMLAFDPADGKELANIEIPDGIFTAPIVAGGVMYMMSEDAKLYAFY